MDAFAGRVGRFYRHPLVRVDGWIILLGVLIGLSVAWRWRRFRAWIS
jgi:hypothetical protein